MQWYIHLFLFAFKILTVHMKYEKKGLQKDVRLNCFSGEIDEETEEKEGTIRGMALHL